MKKLTVFAVLLLALSVGGLWAQERTEDGVIYDTIVQETTFSYGVGFALGLQTKDIDFRHYYNPQNYSEYTHYDGYYDSIDMSLFYRAEWENYIFSIAPAYYMQRASTKDQTFRRNVLRNDNQNMFGVEVQALGRFPLAKDQLQSSLFGGFEFVLHKTFGLSALLGADIGVKVTDHHAVFLAASAGFPLVPFDEVAGGDKFMRGEIQDDAGYEFRGMPAKFQISLGVRTLILENVYYYHGEEVARGK